MNLFLEKQTWLAVDTETTGLNPWKHEIIEIGAVRFTLNGIQDRFQVLINPVGKQDPRAREIHNISNEELREDGLPAKAGLAKFLDFAEKTDMVFHNAPFDMGFLTMAIKNQRLKMPDCYYFDSLYLSRNYFPERKSHSLFSLKKELKIDTGPLHRALSDAEATSIVFLDILEKKGGGIESKRSMQSFMKFTRKANKFDIKLPRDLDQIQKYFEKFIKSSSFITIEYLPRNRKKKIKRVVQPLEFMIFNQKLYLKSSVQPFGETEIVPITGSTIYDKDLGAIQY